MLSRGGGGRYIQSLSQSIWICTKNQGGLEVGPEEELSLRAIRKVTVQEFGKIDLEFNQFKEEVCKVLNGVEKRVDLKLSKSVG